MAVALLIAGPDDVQPVVGPKAAECLAELGITRISLLSDRTGIGVVLEGWAFDPARVEEAVRAVFPGEHASVRILHEIELVAVSPALSRRSTTR